MGLPALTLRAALSQVQPGLTLLKPEQKPGLLPVLLMEL
jgi:hypothetical protein